MLKKMDKIENKLIDVIIDVDRFEKKYPNIIKKEFEDLDELLTQSHIKIAIIIGLTKNFDNTTNYNHNYNFNLFLIVKKAVRKRLNKEKR